MKTAYLMAVAVLIVGILLASCTQQQPIDRNPPGSGGDFLGPQLPVGNVTVGETTLTGSQEIKKFNNVNELKQFLLQSQLGQAQGIGYSRNMLAVGAPMAAGMEKAGADMGGTQGAIDYSQTNVQVEGVDEADFVKNDDKYIYLIAGNKLVIVDGYQGKDAEIISETSIPGMYDRSQDQGASKVRPYYYYQAEAKELFINGDKLVLFVQGYEPDYYFQKYDIQPQETSKPKLSIYLYDTTDRTKPKLEREFTATGSYYQSRMIGDIIYMVTQEGINNVIYPPIPLITEKASGTVIRPDIYYFDNPDQNYQLNTVTSLDLGQEEVVDSKSFMLGYANTLMVSESNIYIAYQKQNYWRWGWWGGSQYTKDRFYDVILPLLEGDLKTDIQEISGRDISEEEQWTLVSERLSEFFREARADEQKQEQYQDMLEKISDALEEYDTKKQLEDRKTVIHKIRIDNGKIDYVAKGEVDGTLENQFSLDEYNGNLRVATTVDIWVKKHIQNNNVYILDADMKEIGSITGIAPDERIYSTRFIGDRLYMVTFKRIDPLFVIDLSDPADPEILGELKIPGYSDYLHPYDENHIIGVGKETGDNEWGGTSLKGVKLALFDVSDVQNPKQVDSVEIGDSGTDSPALYDHKAFLFSKSKNLLVIPVAEVTQRERQNDYLYSYRIWHGAYAFRVDTNGFTELGKVEHSSQKSDYYNWFDQASVQRSLYLDDYLFTISNKYIKVNDLGSQLASLASITLPQQENQPYYGRGEVMTGVAVPSKVMPDAELPPEE